MNATKPEIDWNADKLKDNPFKGRSIERKFRHKGFCECSKEPCCDRDCSSCTCRTSYPPEVKL